MMLVVGFDLLCSCTRTVGVRTLRVFVLEELVLLLLFLLPLFMTSIVKYQPHRSSVPMHPTHKSSMLVQLTPMRSMVTG